MVGETLDRSERAGGADGGPPLPGLVLVWTRGAPALEAMALAGGALVLGREAAADVRAIDDARLSRRHAEVTWRAGAWAVRDLGSKNGSACDAREGAHFEGDFRVLRVGDSLLVPCADVRPLAGAAVSVADGVVVGPRLRALWDEVARVARSSDVLHVRGETGSGKELAARRFHAAGPYAGGPFVAVNCAGIPAALAERLLLGAKKGAYSGADADAEGFLGAADGGTLFLDEIAELPLEVQAKLLRVLETHEVLALGATKARKVDVRVCSATHGDLRAAVAAGRFREDLYYRLARPSVALLALRERAEEVPWLVQAALPRGAHVHVSLVEAALARPWPGNVRELIAEVADAAGRAGKQRVAAEHLSAQAGLPLVDTPTDPPSDARRDPARIEAALREHGGNVAAAARALGLHRNQLRRFLDKK